MLRVICGQCGKKLEMPDAWAHNVVKCPQCREPINLQEHDSAECAVKLGQFLNENLTGGDGAGGKFGLSGRPPRVWPSNRTRSVPSRRFFSATVWWWRSSAWRCCWSCWTRPGSIR